MIYPESEATEHWCPKALVLSPQSSASPINRTAAGFPPGTGCLGSRCALWRWVDGEIEYLENVLIQDTQLKADGWKFARGAGNGYGTLQRPFGDRRTGRCGLI